jgi:hypothetical protein
VTRWVWDPPKAAENFRKHRVTFEFAASALTDPLVASRLDPFPFEERWQTIVRPVTDSDLLLVVFQTVGSRDGESTGRIVSARQEERKERRAYEAGEF